MSNIDINTTPIEKLTADDIHNLMKAKYGAMTKEELINDKKNLIRCFRNQKLEESDKYMGQNDRYTPKQIEELKTYRQALRDFINNFNWNDLSQPLELPPEPEIIRAALLNFPLKTIENLAKH